MDYAHKIV